MTLFWLVEVPAQKAYILNLTVKLFAKPAGDHVHAAVYTLAACGRVVEPNK